MTEVLVNAVELSTFAQFYRALHEKDVKAQLVDYLQNAFLSKVDIEPVTGEPSIAALSHIATSTKLQSQDKFIQLLSYCDAALKSVINHPRYKVVREHGFVPIYKAQQLDSRSVQWLSRQPGNNIRQKLSANPHVLALTRRDSLDTLENRFVHHIIQYLDYLLVTKRESGGLNDAEDWLAQELDSWCSKEEVKEIKTWQAIPPNNVLLEDKSYQKIWRVGNKLNRLDDEISHIYNNLEVSFSHRLWLEIIAHMQSVKGIHLIESMLSSDVADLTYKNAYDSVVHEDKNLEARGIYSLNEMKHVDVSVTYHFQKSEIVLVAHYKQKKYYTISISSNDVAVRNEKYHQILSYSLLNSNVQVMAVQIVQAWLGESRAPRSFKMLSSDIFATIDLSGSRPAVRLSPSKPNSEHQFNNSELKSSLSLRLLTQKIGDNKAIDLSLATAIDLDQDSKLLTYASIYDKDNASLIADLIAKSIKTPKVHYLLSDHISDFDSKVVRREFNRIFQSATPLPKSIAAAFSLKAKTNNLITKGELLVVLEHGTDGLYATPVVAQKNEREAYWERHPSFKLNSKGTNDLVHLALKDEYPKAVVDVLCSVFSYAELIKRNGKPAIKYKGNWFILNESNRNKIVGKNVEVSKNILFQLLKVHGIKDYSSLNIIALGPSIQGKDFHPKQWHKNLDITCGSQALYELISANMNSVYWRDHLPKLLTRLPFDGKEVELVFVDDKTTIEPKRGKRVALDIKSKFTIPAGEKNITLPIFQGQGKDIKRFSLTLDHSAFPLKNDVHCILDLGYTYGDEEPYQLIFRPIDDNAPFNQALAKWSNWAMTQEQKLVCPQYPKVQTVMALAKFTSQGKKETDVLEWSERVFNDIDDYRSFFVTRESSKRISIKLSEYNYSYSYDYQKVHLECGEVAIKMDQFEDGLFDKQPDEISGRLVKNHHVGYKLEAITSIGNLPKSEIESIASRWRFPILTLFDQERSMRDDDFPRELQEKAGIALKKAVELLDSEIPTRIEQELKQFISYFHCNVPENIANKWIEDTKCKINLRNSKSNISYALGGCSTDWQQNLLNSILMPIDDNGDTQAVSLEILGTAVWRSKSLVYQLTNKQIDTLVNRLSHFITHEELNIKINDKHFKWNSLLRRLELAFALLRLRASDKQSIAHSMEVGSANSDKLLNAIQIMNKKRGSVLFDVMQRDNKVMCRVHLSNINKPESFNKTPDILYALNMYLSGDDGANSITISEISSE